MECKKGIFTEAEKPVSDFLVNHQGPRTHKSKALRVRRAHTLTILSPTFNVVELASLFMMVSFRLGRQQPAVWPFSTETTNRRVR